MFDLFTEFSKIRGESSSSAGDFEEFLKWKGEGSVSLSGKDEDVQEPDPLQEMSDDNFSGRSMDDDGEQSIADGGMFSTCKFFLQSVGGGVVFVAQACIRKSFQDNL